MFYWFVCLFDKFTHLCWTHEWVLIPSLQIKVGFTRIRSSRRNQIRIRPLKKTQYSTVKKSGPDPILEKHPGSGSYLILTSYSPSILFLKHKSRNKWYVSQCIIILINHTERKVRKVSPSAPCLKHSSGKSPGNRQKTYQENYLEFSNQICII